MSQDGNLTFKVEQLIDHVQMMKDMNYSPADLTTAMVEQASIFAHYGVLLSRASAQVDNCKMLLEIAEGKIAKRIRDQAVADGRKMTEPQLAAEVTITPVIVGLKRSLNEAKRVEQMAKSAVEGMRHRRDMLVSNSLISREEMKGEMSLAIKKANADNLQETQNRILERRRLRAEGVSEE